MVLLKYCSLLAGLPLQFAQGLQSRQNTDNSRSGPDSLTFAILLPYALIDVPSHNDTDPSYFPDSIRSNVIANEAAAEMAIEDIINDPTVFPNTKINVVKRNIWDPSKAQNFAKYDSGGYAAIEAIKAVNDDKAVAVFGDFLDKTTGFTAPVLSTYQVPFCGSTQTNPDITDPSLNPLSYFFTTQTGYEYGSAVLALLDLWNVTQFSVIVGYDDISTGYADDFQATYMSSPLKNKIKQENKIYITPQMHANKDYGFPLSILSSGYSKYYVMIGSPKLTADFYFQARAYKLVGSTNVWIGNNIPYVGTSLAEQLQLYGSYGVSDVQGFVWVKHNIQGPSSDAYSKFIAKWKAKNAQNSRKYWIAPNGNLPQYSRQSYDCVQLLLRGLSRVSNDPKKINDREFRKSSVSQASFANTGYEGVISSPIKLDKSGFLKTPYIFISMNERLMNSFEQRYDDIDETYAFAKTGLSDSSVVMNNRDALVFYGGGKEIPNEYFVPEIEDLGKVSTKLRWVIVGLEVFGIALLLASMAFFVYDYVEATKSKGKPAQSLGFSVALHSGLLIVFASLHTLMQTEDIPSCNVQRFCIPIGLTLAFGAILSKLVHLSRSLQNKFERARGVSISYLIVCIVPFLLANILLAIIWSSAGQPYVAVVFNHQNTTFYNVCKTQPAMVGDVVTYVVYGLNLLLLASCVLYAANLRSESEIKYLDLFTMICGLCGIAVIIVPFLPANIGLQHVIRAFIIWTLCLGTVLIFLLPPLLLKHFKIGMEKDDIMIKSGINREMTNLIDSDSPWQPLHLGPVQYQILSGAKYMAEKEAFLIFHRNRGQLIMTLSEMYSDAVASFNVSMLIENELLMSSGTSSQSQTRTNVTEVSAVSSVEKASPVGNNLENPDATNFMLDDDEAAREVLVISRGFSVRLVASSVSQARDINAQLFSGGTSGSAPSSVPASATPSVNGPVSSKQKN